MAASFVSEHYGGPKFLYALLISIAFHFLSDDARCVPGIEFSAKKLMRIGVALLGARIVMANVSALGLWTTRSEERRVGKECRSRWSPYH